MAAPVCGRFCWKLNNLKGMTVVDTSNMNSEQYRAAAEKWLNVAIKAEADDRPVSLIDRALRQACEYENAAVT